MNELLRRIFTAFWNAGYEQAVCDFNDQFAVEGFLSSECHSDDLDHVILNDAEVERFVNSQQTEVKRMRIDWENTTMGDRLGLWLHYTDGTQAAFAKRVGVSKSLLSHVVAGRREMSTATLRKLADGGIDIHWLVTGREHSGRRHRNIKGPRRAELMNAVGICSRCERSNCEGPEDPNCVHAPGELTRNDHISGPMRDIVNSMIKDNSQQPEPTE